MAEFSSCDLGQQRDEPGEHGLGRAEDLRSVCCILSAPGGLLDGVLEGARHAFEPGKV
jgi:hypothetical protein